MHRDDLLAQEADQSVLQELYDRLVAMTEERDWLWQRTQWLATQEWKAWERIRELEEELVVIRSKRSFYH